MTAAPGDGETVFRAVLSPNRSLSPNGFAIVMGAIALISFAAGTAFMLMGAWPVFGFFGLDVALVYWAFKRNFRDAERREVIEVTQGEVIVRATGPRRQPVEQRFTRPWVRVSLVRDEARELIGALTLNQSGRSCEIGSFLGPDDKAGFYDALRRVLEHNPTGVRRGSTGLCG